MTVATIIAWIFGIIVLTICYFSVGAFLGSLAVDDPNTPELYGYIVACFWPVCCIGLIIWVIVWGSILFLYKTGLALFCGIRIERDSQGNKRVRKLKDQVFIRRPYGTFVEYKPDIEENLNNNLEKRITEQLHFWTENPEGKFLVDLMKYSNRRITEDEMLKRHSKVCPNLKRILRYDWNIKDVPGI